jgi:hypothetical protein
MKKCPHCQSEYKLNVVAQRKSKIKALRTGCCDVFVRWCPNPCELLKTPYLTQDERNFLSNVAEMNWFSAKTALLLLQIEAKGKEVAA